MKNILFFSLLLVSIIAHSQNNDDPSMSKQILEQIRKEKEPQLFLSVKGEIYGPFNWQEINQMVQNEQLTKNTLVWKPGMEGWELAGNVQALVNLVGAFPQPAEVPPVVNEQNDENNYQSNNTHDEPTSNNNNKQKLTKSEAELLSTLLGVAIKSSSDNCEKILYCKKCKKAFRFCDGWSHHNDRDNSCWQPPSGADKQYCSLWCCEHD